MNYSSNGSDVSTSIEKILETLDRLTRRIDRLERLIRISSTRENQDLLFNFLSLAKAPYHVVFQSVLRAWIVLYRLGRVDPVTESIIYVLSNCSEQSISEVYRGVKQLRRKASRTVVSRKLKLLEASGVVVNKGSSKRPRYILKECITVETK